MRIHLSRDTQEDLLEAMVSALPKEFDVSTGGEAPPDTNVLVVGFPSLEMLERLPELTTVVIPFAGLVPSARDALLTRPALKVYNLHHNAAATAEKAIELLLAVCKKTVANDQLMRKGFWSPRFETSEARQLDGLSVLIVGFGEIGKRVGKACLALGMSVTGVKRTVLKALDGEVAVHEFTELPSLWPTADVVVVCAPLTPETEGLVDRAALLSFRPGAILVNVGRGKVVDEEALYEALASGHLFGAGLDVWWQYPKEDEPVEPSKFPFKDLPNVVMSPHIGGSVQDTEPRRMAALIELLRQIHLKDPRLKPIDVSRGY